MIRKHVKKVVPKVFGQSDDLFTLFRIYVNKATLDELDLFSQIIYTEIRERVIPLRITKRVVL